jgi:hypothetical protein
VTTSAALAAYGLEGSSSLGDAPVVGGSWYSLVRDAQGQRITGHLVRALADGALRGPDTHWEQACAAHREALGVDLVLDRLLVATSTRLRAVGIEHRALKGAALAYGVYPTPELRSYGDVDVLVDSARYDDAIAMLCADGGEPRYPEPRPGFTSRFGKGVCVVTADGLEIDVHRTFVAGPFGLAVALDDLFATPTIVRLAGTDVPALAAVPRLLHACFHASLGDRLPRLVPLRDVAQILLTTDVDVDATLECAARWRCRAVVQHAVLSTWGLLQLRADHALLRWARAYEPDRFERTALHAYVGRNRSYATQSAAGLFALHGVRARAEYARAMLFPGRAYTRSRGGYVARFRRSARIARSWNQSA